MIQPVIFPASVNLYIFPGLDLIISCYALQDFQVTTWLTEPKKKIPGWMILQV